MGDLLDLIANLLERLGEACLTELMDRLDQLVQEFLGALAGARGPARGAMEGTLDT